jgi:hypothetical protein
LFQISQIKHRLNKNINYDKEKTFKLTNNLAVPVSTLVGTAEPNIPQGSNRWFLPLVTRSNAIMDKVSKVL